MKPNIERFEKYVNQEIVNIRGRLKEIILEKSIRIAPPDQPFILTSGLTSGYYINGKKTCADPEGLFCLSRLILEHVKDVPVDAIGGPTLGADPIVAGVSLLSHLMGRNIPLFIVRKETKQHGTKQTVEGAEIEGKKVVLVEDVVTTGGSVFKAVEIVKELGCEILDIIVIVDREQGGQEAFAKAGLSYSPLFKISDLLPDEVLNR